VVSTDASGKLIASPTITDDGTTLSVTGRNLSVGNTVPGQESFLMSTWASDAFGLRLLNSLDAATFSPVSGSVLAGPAPAGYYPDPGFLHDKTGGLQQYAGKYWIAADNSTCCGLVGTTFSLRWSLDLQNWNEVGPISVAVAGANRTWAPDIFRDDDGTIYATISVSTDGETTFYIYGATLSGENLTTVGTWHLLLDLPGHKTIDPQMLKTVNGSGYAIFAKDASQNIDYATSSTPLGTYAAQVSNLAFGEGPWVVQTSATNWRLYFDTVTVPNQGLWFKDSTDGWATWSAAQQVKSPWLTRHGSIVRYNDISTYRNAISLMAVNYFRSPVFTGGIGLGADVLPAPVITQGGTPGAVAYAYGIAAVYAAGPYVVSATTSTATGAATLNGTNYNIVVLPALSTGQQCWDVWRTSSAGTPSTTGKIVSCVTGASYNDKGAAGNGGTFPTVNTVLPTTASTAPNLPAGCLQLPCSVAAGTPGPQTANWSAMTIYTTPDDGTNHLYRASIYIVVSVAGTGNGTLNSAVGYVPPGLPTQTPWIGSQTPANNGTAGGFGEITFVSSPNCPVSMQAFCNGTCTTVATYTPYYYLEMVR
jgi:hypothetical protein